MNVFQKVSIFFKFKGVMEEEIKEGKMDTASGKPGWKTSEFYWGVATQLGVLWSAVAGFVPPKWAAIISTAGVALYTIARTVSKAVSDIQTVKSNSATVTTTQPSTVITGPAQ